MSRLSKTAIRDIVGEDAAVEERQAVRVVGVVTGISMKTTKKDEQMAFFTVEDRYAEIECLAFPRQYVQFSTELRADAAVLIEGNLSFRDEETPKILVSRVEPLIEDRLYREDSTPPRTERVQVQKAPTSSHVREEKPNAVKATGTYTKAYLRLDNFNCEAYRKVTNLLDIFDDGAFPVILYDRSTEKYVAFSHGVAMSDYVRRELEGLIGAENVVFR